MSKLKHFYNRYGLRLHPEDVAEESEVFTDQSATKPVVKQPKEKKWPFNFEPTHFVLFVVAY